MPAKTRGVRVCNHESALNDAIGLELALDAYHVIRTQKHVCRKMQAIFGDVHDFALYRTRNRQCLPAALPIFAVLDAGNGGRLSQLHSDLHDRYRPSLARGTPHRANAGRSIGCFIGNRVGTEKASFGIPTGLAAPVGTV